MRKLPVEIAAANSDNTSFAEPSALPSASTLQLLSDNHALPHRLASVRAPGDVPQMECHRRQPRRPRSDLDVTQAPTIICIPHASSSACRELPGQRQATSASRSRSHGSGREGLLAFSASPKKQSTKKAGSPSHWEHRQAELTPLRTLSSELTCESTGT